MEVGETPVKIGFSSYEEQDSGVVKIKWFGE